MTTHETYIKRCLELAGLGIGNVAPNPMVGALLVYQDRIIAEGWHQKYGHAHAEVNCLNNVAPIDQHLIKDSTMYVSLEPCSHFGKTPPCSDLIIRHKIKRVVIGCKDSFESVNGLGIEKLKQAGVEIILGDWAPYCKHFNRQFFHFHQKKQPFVTLKWASSLDGYIAQENQQNSQQRTHISSAISNRLVHKWRSENAAIMVGTQTALLDNPSLTNRLWSGPQPVRIVLDRQLQIKQDANLFDNSAKTIVFNQLKESINKDIQFIQYPEQADPLPFILKKCHEMDIQSLFVEGGRKLLTSFIESNLWQEAVVITNKNLLLKDGIKAPVLSNAILQQQQLLSTDIIDYYTNIQ